MARTNNSGTISILYRLSPDAPQAHKALSSVARLRACQSTKPCTKYFGISREMRLEKRFETTSEMGSESEPQTRTHAHICVVRGKLGICTRTGTIVPVWLL